MSLADQSSPSSDAQPWRWRLEDSSGAEVSVDADLAGRTFPTQADAESWVGEFWPDLADAGVTAVTLFEVDREVYGPMSLEA
jgi:hypothetical protein